MKKSNQQGTSTSTSSRTPHKTSPNSKKESKSSRMNLKSSKTKALKSTKPSKTTIISNNLRFTKEIKQRPS